MLLAIVNKDGDVQTFDTDEDGVMLVIAMSLPEVKRVLDRVVLKHEKARDNVLEKNNDLYVFATAKLNTADADSEYRRRQYRARDTLANRKNWRAYMGEELRSPGGSDAQSAILPVSPKLILPNGTL